MTSTFPIDDARIRELSATRQGRVSIAGFDYQASYAVARLASMLVRHPILELDDYPTALRYDWAEDLDELELSGRTVFTQCKRMSDIGQPAKLADVLLSFAPKLLWAESGRRSALRFRLVCTDPRYRGDAPLAFSTNVPANDRKKALDAFLGVLATPPGSGSDRALWQADAAAFGFNELFDALWEATEGVYLRGEPVTADPVGMPLLAAERAALSLLIIVGEIDAANQAKALTVLRSLIHGNLISFNPVSGLQKAHDPRSPRILRRRDVLVELFTLRTTREIAFHVVTPQFLAQQRAKEKQMYMARQPQWADVVHGQDREVRFVERDLTTELRDRIRSHILQPLARGTDERLPMLFLLGAPGAGKSTLIRRVAALLVEEEAVTVADFTSKVGEHDQEEMKAIVADLKVLATPERPVLIVLDDPFFADSGWPKLLRRLAQARLPIGVIGASPDFLFEAFGADVRRDPFHTDAVPMAKPSAVERAALSDLHCRPLQSSTEEDFLVLAMEAAAGESFSTIVGRIWTTLNDGRVIDPRAEPEMLPWTVRAYLITCYLHRFGERCPEALLRAALTLDGASVPANLDRSLRTLISRSGWNIFSIQEPGPGPARHEGQTIGASHQRVASEAWKLRPMPEFDPAEWVIPASIRSNQPFAVGRLAGALAGSASKVDARFPARLAKAWSEACEADVVSASSLSSLAGVLRTNAAHPETSAMIAAFRRSAALLNAESWIAALQLRTLSSSDESERSFPEGVDLAAVIEAADFSIAPSRATVFSKTLVPKSPLYVAYVERLFSALEGLLDWSVDPVSLTWLLSRVPVAEIGPERLGHARRWIEQHPDDNSARSRFLEVVSTFPADDPVRVEFMNDTLLWLDAHQNDDNVRKAFLGSVANLHSSDRLRQTFLKDTWSWLENNLDDDLVRTKYLDIVRALPEGDELRRMVLEKTAAWLDDHTHDTTVRPIFLTVADSLDVGFDTLVKSAELLDKQRVQRWQVVADSMVQPYLRAFWSAKKRRDKAALEKLSAVRDSIIGWYEAREMTPPDLNTRTPKSASRHFQPNNARSFDTLADAFRSALVKRGDE